jgi:hypothetical protein
MGIHTDTVKDESFLTLFIAGPEKGKNWHDVNSLPSLTNFLYNVHDELHVYAEYKISGPLRGHKSVIKDTVSLIRLTKM